MNSRVLDQPAGELPVSAEFREMMQLLHFDTLRDLLRFPPRQLLRMEAFGYRSLKELITLLEEHGLADCIKE